jgi:hypothetical protein
MTLLPKQTASVWLNDSPAACQHVFLGHPLPGRSRRAEICFRRLFSAQRGSF